MKKAIIFGITGLLTFGLSACGGNATQSNSTSKGESKARTEETEKRPVAKTTSDILVAAKKNTTFVDENTGKYEITGEYLNGPTNDGMYQIIFGESKDKAFILNYAVKLATNPDGEKGLLFLEKGDNTKSGKLIDYSGTKIDIITDTAEEIGDDIDNMTNEENKAGVTYGGPVINKGFIFIKFENQDKTPQKVNIDFEAPDLLLKNDNGEFETVPGDSNTGTQRLGKNEHVTLKLSKLD
ncbi:hypothetical protein [Heyndrickxia coagulans]|uniref:Lipoprotein n=1 Tax=Heyndrickxia coagulans TaxID=1398 RepID=A0A150KGW0_HEYCO|nr:hypothetical protein [Heyndrickxia coagulans]KYC71624.1 hypothetical protein B4099_3165 [Heyndrickxia coagulans]